LAIAAGRSQSTYSGLTVALAACALPAAVSAATLAVGNDPLAYQDTRGERNSLSVRAVAGALIVSDPAGRSAAPIWRSFAADGEPLHNVVLVGARGVAVGFFEHDERLASIDPAGSAPHGTESDAGELVASVGDEGGEGLLELSFERFSLAAW
jgi:hypothetical protein